jgi:hypothetical protein
METAKMKPKTLTSRIGLAVALLLGTGSQIAGDISIRLSVKFILNSDGSRPVGGIGSSSGFDAEVERDNRILAATGRGFNLQVVEYFDIQPTAPAGQPANYWFELNARSNRLGFELAAIGDPTTWKWNGNAINLFVNNSDSGQCSFPGTGGSISLGKSIAQGTVLHEIGHYFYLLHTHAGDPECKGPSYPVADGDLLAETIPDHNCLDRDSLSKSNFNGRAFNDLNENEQAQVNTSWLNVMSYHQEDQLLDDQMDLWTDTANGTRRGVCTGRTWFVDRDGCPIPAGGSVCVLVGGPFGTVRGGVEAANSGDIVLVRSGNYDEQLSITKAITVRATRGGVTIGKR